MSRYEPPEREIRQTRFLGRTLLRPYYAGVARRLNLNGDEHVLDYGSGSGIASWHIARRLVPGRGRLTCVDISTRWMDVARRTLRRFNHVTFKRGAIGSVGLEDGAYDVVHIHFVLHDIPASERQHVVRQLARKLRPGGRLVLREPTNPNHGMQPDEIMRLMQRAGLSATAMQTGRMLLFQPIVDATFIRA